jgi:glycosyltransferase involved in cell wall biosynthesis
MPLRVALFPDSLNEVNGVANTCRHFAEYARARNLPLLVVYGASQNTRSEQGTVQYLGLKRGSVSIQVERDLQFDLAFMRHLGRVEDALRSFRPDVVHITGQSDLGFLGTIGARKLRVPLVASWHTNLQEYAARRLDRNLPKWPLNGQPRQSFLNWVEETAFRLSVLHFNLARFHFAPNAEMIEKLQGATSKSCRLMERGIDLDLFSPKKRDRAIDGEFVIGYVGRLSTEKNLRGFAPLAQRLREAGHANVRFVFVGHGSEEIWLRKNFPDAVLTGVLKGEELSRAYANLDLLVFFSETDTFGNVVLEALASGVPAVVSDKGGPKFIVDEHSGFVCANDEEFALAVMRVIKDEGLRSAMSAAARKRAERASWDAVFDAVYHGYEFELRAPDRFVVEQTAVSSCLKPDL